MKPDPIVEEVRAIRSAHAKEFNYNLEAIYEDLRRKGEEWAIKTVSRPPRLLADGKKTG